MAKRNKRRTQTGSRAIFMAASLGIFMFFAALIYLWVDQSCYALGQDIKKLEAEGRELDKKVSNEEGLWSSAKSTSSMVVLLEKHGLKMGNPDEKNIIRLQRVDEDVFAQHR